MVTRSGLPDIHTLASEGSREEWWPEPMWDPDVGLESSSGQEPPFEDAGSGVE